MVRYGLTLGAALLLIVACGGGGHQCPEGYHWDDSTGQCEIDTSIPDETNDIDLVKDDAASPDEETIEEDAILPDDDGYTGPCLFAEEGSLIVFDVVLHTITFGPITVNGISNDSLVQGELWAEDETTKSEFKVAELSPALTGKNVHLAPGTYRFFYRGPKAKPDDPDNTAVVIAEQVTVAGTMTLPIDLPLVTISGTVTKNGAAFPALTGAAATETKITLQNGTYSFEIPYSNFADFTLTVPKGTYTATFSGHLSDGAPAFYAKFRSGTTALTVDSAASVPLDIVTATVNGNASIEGVALSSGLLAIVKDPPLEPISTILVGNLGSSTAYNAEIVANEGVTYTIVYLAEQDDYPYSMIRLTQWSEFSSATTGSVSLDFGRVSGTISLKTAGGPFPALTSCQPTEAQCTRGRLKAMSMASGTVILKDLGASGDDYTYSALLVRRQKVCKNLECTEFEYTPQPFSLYFESYFNDIAGMTNYLPFTTKVSVNGIDAFQFVSGSDFITEMQLDIVVSPLTVSGTVTFEGSPVSNATDDILFLRDTTTQTETPVVNLGTLSDGTYSFMAPAGAYHVVYKGSHLFGYDQRGTISTDLTIGTSDIAGKTLNIGTAKVQLDLTINGGSIADFITAHPAIARYDFSAANDKNTLGNSAITPVAAEPYPYFKLLTSSTWDIYLNLYVTEGADTSVFRFSLAQLVNVSGDTMVQKALTIVPFEAGITANGASVNGSGSSRATLDITGDTRAKVFFPPTGNAHLFLLPATYANPSPQMTLGAGFDTAQRLITDCIFVSE